jgi:hypothetical protein
MVPSQAQCPTKPLSKEVLTQLQLLAVIQECQVRVARTEEIF